MSVAPPTTGVKSTLLPFEIDNTLVTWFKLSVCESVLELMNPNAVICADELTVPSGVLSPLDDTNPNAVICADELTIEDGTFIKSVYEDTPLPVGIVTVFPLAIVSWSPLIESVCESEPVSSVAFSKDTNRESNEEENAEYPLVSEILICSEPLTIPVPPNVNC